FDLTPAGPAIRPRRGEQRNQPRDITGLAQPLLVAVEIELQKPERSERGVELAGGGGVVKAAAGLAPGGAHVDEEPPPVAARALELALHQLGHLARRRR